MSPENSKAEATEASISGAAGSLRDHGGDLERAMARYGGSAEEWIDLSTGINPEAYPAPNVSRQAWTRLPGSGAEAALLAAARSAYGVADGAAILAVPGAQAAIQLVPRLRRPGRVAIVSPTYNEHAAAFAAEGWAVEPVARLEAASGSEALVAVNPNNPDGRRFDPARLAAAAKGGRLVVVDESFADAAPDASAAGLAGGDGLIVLRSFGKFFGLAGLRLGFAIGAAEQVARLREMLGPWGVSGPALEIGRAALRDRAWSTETIARLGRDAARMDAAAARAGWRVVGGTALFRLVETPDAAAAQARLAARRIWTRRFPYSERWLRLGLPASAQWSRVEEALR